MKTHPNLLDRPGIYHVMLRAADGSPEQNAWLDLTCTRVEAFIHAREISSLALPVVSMSVHATADFLFARFGGDADFALLDPAALIATMVREAPELVSEIAGTLAMFYEWLLEVGEIEAPRGRYLACYFVTLLELHGVGHARVQPTRASRRATATLARRIAEARVRTDLVSTRSDELSDRRRSGT